MRIHFIGIKGVSMEFLARLCRNAGVEVTGSDLKSGGHDARNVHGADAVVYTLAVGDDNPELFEARRLDIPAYTRAELLGGISRGYGEVVAVSGTHGKTTTTAMLMSMLPDATVHMGGSVGGTCGRIGGKNLFVTEACEYKESFLCLKPTAAIVTNVELDHADYYRTYEQFYEAFKKFVESSKVAFVCGDNEAASLRAYQTTYTFGLGSGNDYRAVIEDDAGGYYTFSALYGGKKFASVKLNVRGEHNVVNAMGAIAYCHAAKRDISGISAFRGVDRRFETLACKDGTEYISDYAHHPREIECTLTLAKKIFSKVLTVFEPHTYSRTAAFATQFASALSISDRCIILPIFAARERQPEGVSSALIKGKFDYAKSYDDAAALIDKTDCDAVIFMGAGTVDEFGRRYVAERV